MALREPGQLPQPEFQVIDVVSGCATGSLELIVDRQAGKRLAGRLHQHVAKRPRRNEPGQHHAAEFPRNHGREGLLLRQQRHRVVDEADARHLPGGRDGRGKRLGRRGLAPENRIAARQRDTRPFEFRSLQRNLAPLAQIRLHPGLAHRSGCDQQHEDRDQTEKPTDGR